MDKIWCVFSVFLPNWSHFINLIKLLLYISLNAGSLNRLSSLCSEKYSSINLISAIHKLANKHSILSTAHRKSVTQLHRREPVAC